jgi:hypothetical protein
VSEWGRLGGHLAREGSPPVSVKQSEGRGKRKSFGECVQRHGSLKNMRHFVRVGRALRASGMNVWTLEEGELLEGSAHFIGTKRNAIQNS